MSETQIRYQVPGNDLMVALLGERDELLLAVEREFDATTIHVRGNEITIDGPDAEAVEKIFRELVLHLERGQWVDAAHVGRTIEMVRSGLVPSEVIAAEVLRPSAGRPVRPMTPGQRRYVDAIAANTITFGIGPAGTGKSYLAVAAAVRSLQAKQVHRIILARPAVEAGERLGFLPGDLMAKVDPYLRPLYDALYDMLEPEGTQRLLDRGTIEVAPLAFMRGRTLNARFVILDEAQNTTPEQMKMFLTRIGFGTKAVVTGDVTQIDVPGGRSGLVGLDASSAGSTASGSSASPAVTSSATGSWPASSTPTSGRRAGRNPRDDRRLRRRRAGRLIDRLARWAELGAPGARRRGVSGDAELSLLFVDEAAIAALNEHFLEGGPTDVLAFPIDDDQGPRAARPTSAVRAGQLVRGRRAPADRRHRDLPGGRGPQRPSTPCPSRTK